jgi:Protein of unknown function (DUF3828)
MPTRRFILGFALVAALGAAGASAAAETSAKDFIIKIYDSYKGKDAPGVTGTSDEDMLAVFEPSLVKLITKDAEEAEKKGEAPKLDGDPFVAAQDWDIESFDIAVRDTGPNKATATVSFKNQDKQTTVTVDLVKLAVGWRVGNVHWSDGDLRGLLTGK